MPGLRRRCRGRATGRLTSVLPELPAAVSDPPTGGDGAVLPLFCRTGGGCGSGGYKVGVTGYRIMRMRVCASHAQRETPDGVGARPPGPAGFCSSDGKQPVCCGSPALAFGRTFGLPLPVVSVKKAPNGGIPGGTVLRLPSGGVSGRFEGGGSPVMRCFTPSPAVNPENCRGCGAFEKS